MLLVNTEYIHHKNFSSIATAFRCTQSRSVCKNSIVKCLPNYLLGKMLSINVIKFPNIYQISDSRIIFYPLLIKNL